MKEVLGACSASAPGRISAGGVCLLPRDFRLGRALSITASI
jgi:hypothetical protein